MEKKDPLQFDDLATSMIIDKNYVENVPKKKIYSWVEDNLVTCCQECNSPFTIWLRRHHCRSCGRIFCYKCSSYAIEVPEDLSLLQTNNNNNNMNNNSYWENFFTNNKNNTSVRVCKKCYKKIDEYKKMNEIMGIFNVLDLDITILQKLRLVCKTWKSYATFKLNKFRELQYVLPNHNFTTLEKQLLWTNYHYIIHHPKYLIQLFKSIDHQSYKEEYKLNKILTYLEKEIEEEKSKVKLPCVDLMCTRYCTATLVLTCEDAISLLNDTIKDVRIRQYAIESFKKLDYKEFICYLPFLVFSIRYESTENSVIGNFLISKCVKENGPTKLELCNELYWELQIQIDQESKTPLAKIYQYFVDKFTAIIPNELVQKITFTKKLVGNLTSFKSDTEAIIKEKFTHIDYKKINIPLNLSADFTLNIDNICVKSSASMPLILPLTYIDQKVQKKYNVMFKYEDIRKDQMIMSLIRLISIILKKYDNIDIPVLTYKIRPTSVNQGFIELVPNSQTIYYIKTNFTCGLPTYIMQNNKKEAYEVVIKRFLKSCAIYCVITYILGIGDRHLDNIMLTNDGTLFHIDFSYILGTDPKPLTNPTMRISTDMIEVLGGAGSENFIEFKHLCTQIYNAIRRHVNLFIILLIPLAETCNIISKEKLYSEIIKRFLPGETCQQAEIQLCSVIDNSSKHYKHTMVDLFHSYGGMYKQTKNTMWDSLFGMFGKRT